ncbi:hypothetical protein H8R13_01105 [Morganella morganii]|uniref:hypothetical protein n=1 Tax=Morganella morganii TaxID=582 RepID=UPI00164AA59F|nr:hypothetical protein [Morganella morganii]MBC4010348.1 hypothetical protein [Morganella morganii]
MSYWFTKHQKRVFFAVTLIRKPKPAITGQNSIFWGFPGYTGDISLGCFLLRNGIYGQKNTGNDDEISVNAFYTEKLQSESDSLWYQLCFISHDSVKTAGLDKLPAI